MKALIFHGPGDVRLEDVPTRSPGPGDVLVEVEVALTDGTDAKAFRRGHPVLLGPPPSPFGHEFCGIDVALGRRVVAANSAPCGACAAVPPRRRDALRAPSPAAERRLRGADPRPGADRPPNLLPVPPGLAPEVAALVEPLACCLHGVDRAGIEPGDAVAILGAGPIGLMLCACVADAGGRPFVVGGRPERRELAPRSARPRGRARRRRDRGGRHASRRGTTPSSSSGRAAPSLFFGGLRAATELAVDAYRLHYEELTLRGAFHHTPATVRAALAFLASGAYPWERLITHQVGLEGVAALLADPPPDYLKAAVLPRISA